jgi:hypothetical protein
MAVSRAKPDAQACGGYEAIVPPKIQPIPFNALARKFAGLYLSKYIDLMRADFG